MSFKLKDHYENPIDRRMAELGWLISCDPANHYETAEQGLFHALVRGLFIYVDAWAASDANRSLGNLLLDADDLEDPERINDPHAAIVTLLGLTLQALEDNIMLKIDPNWGQAEPQEVDE